MDALTFDDDDKTCYAGFTPLPYEDGFIQSPVAVGKELVLMYRNVGGGSMCQIPFAFTPEAGATYTLRTGSWSQPKTGILPMFTYDQNYCGVGVVKKVGTVESVEPVKQLRMKTGFPCLRFLEKKQ